MNYRKNHEGYYDPTAGEAIEHIVHEERRQRKLAQSKAAQWDTQQQPEATNPTDGEGRGGHDGR